MSTLSSQRPTFYASRGKAVDPPTNGGPPYAHMRTVLAICLAGRDLRGTIASRPSSGLAVPAAGLTDQKPVPTVPPLACQPRSQLRNAENGPASRWSDAGGGAAVCSRASPVGSGDERGSHRRRPGSSLSPAHYRSVFGAGGLDQAILRPFPPFCAPKVRVLCQRHARFFGF
jgi:hypothetical protein